MLEHGGRLRAAAKQWNIPLRDWLDISTGISPWSFPIPQIPAACWQRLPEDEDGLESAAQSYYAALRALPLPGSQAAIQTLPKLRPTSQVAVLSPSYGEYAVAWKSAGHRLRPFSAGALEHVAKEAEVVVLGNPNNPDGSRFEAEQLLAAARQLSQRGGWLIVDEAFADAEPVNHSLAPLAGSRGLEGLIVLRSLGKFFGLAGLRVGFALAHDDILSPLREAIGPWAIAHPARYIATQALHDQKWQTQHRQRLNQAGALMSEMLKHSGLGNSKGTALFRTISHPRARLIYEYLAHQGILVRCFDHPGSLRFGLPADEAGWIKLKNALARLPAF